MELFTFDRTQVAEMLVVAGLKQESINDECVKAEHVTVAVNKIMYKYRLKQGVISQSSYHSIINRIDSDYILSSAV